MRRRSISTALLACSLAAIAGCGGNDSTAEAQVEYGTYVRLADPSFETIEACEEAKQEADDGILFNCTQVLTLNDDGTSVSILTDIAEPGSFTIDGDTLVLARDLDGSTIEIPIDDDGTLGDGWELDPTARLED